MEQLSLQPELTCNAGIAGGGLIYCATTLDTHPHNIDNYFPGEFQIICRKFIYLSLTTVFHFRVGKGGKVFNTFCSFTHITHD